MFRNTSTLIIVIVAAFVAVIGSMLWLNKNNAVQGDSAAPSKAPVQLIEPEKDTVGAQWNWDNMKKHEKEKTTTSDVVKEDTGGSEGDFPYTAEEIYNALQQIRMDEQGNIVIDHILLWSLNDAITTSLTPQNIADLKELIQLGLPGAAGEQTAELVGKFYDFINARKEYEDMLQTQKEPDMDAHAKQQQEVLTMREMYLGAETSHKLFAKSDADTAYMVGAMSLHSNNELNEDQKKEAIKAINEKYIEQSMSAMYLNDKYALYLQRKTEIQAQGGDEESIEQALNDAKQEIFSRRELTEIAHLPM